MAYMAQLPEFPGYRTWACSCGRHSLAAAVTECPGCGKPQPGTEPAAADAPPAAPAQARAAAAPRPARKRTRTTRTAKGG